MKLPPHVGLIVAHNQHKLSYEPIAEYVGCERFDFKDEAAKARSVATDEIWEVQWYPNTPVGFRCVAAPTLDEALELASQC